MGSGSYHPPGGNPAGPDWTIARQAQKKLTATQSTRIRSWNQAAIHYKQGDKTKACPLCNVPATPKHIVWLCTWHRKQEHEPLPIPWTERLQDPLEEDGFPKEPQDHLNGRAWNHCHSNLGKVCRSPLTPLPLLETSEPKHGFLPQGLDRKPRPELCSRPHHLSPVRPDTSQRHCPAGIGVGGMDQSPQEIRIH